MVEEDTWENRENLGNVKELVEEFEREYGEEAEELRRQELRRNFAGNYQGNLRPNYYMNGGEKDMKRKERGDGMRIGINGKIPQDEES